MVYPLTVHFFCRQLHFELSTERVINISIILKLEGIIIHSLFDVETRKLIKALVKTIFKRDI